MRIHGLQKMTLLDFPQHVACTVFLSGCDYRCPFCHNFELAEGSMPSLMDDRELLAFLEKRKGLLDGVAITGGEPCLYAELPELIGRIRSLGFAVKLDTNGAHPDMLRSLMDGGLVDYVAMDIKNAPEKYAMTVGLETVDLGPVQRSVDMLIAGDVDYEFRTTVVDEFHEEADFVAIGRWIRGARRYFLQCFTDRDTVPFGNLHAPSREKMELCRAAAEQFVTPVALRGVD